MFKNEIPTKSVSSIFSGYMYVFIPVSDAVKRRGGVGWGEGGGSDAKIWRQTHQLCIPPLPPSSLPHYRNISPSFPSIVYILSSFVFYFVFSNFFPPYTNVLSTGFIFIIISSIFPDLSNSLFSIYVLQATTYRRFLHIGEKTTTNVLYKKCTGV